MSGFRSDLGIDKNLAYHDVVTRSLLPGGLGTVEITCGGSHFTTCHEDIPLQQLQLGMQAAFLHDLQAFNGTGIGLVQALLAQQGMAFGEQRLGPARPFGSLREVEVESTDGSVVVAILQFGHAR